MSFLIRQNHRLWRDILAMVLIVAMFLGMTAPALALESGEEGASSSGTAVAVSEITETGAKLTITNSGETTGYPVAFYLVKGADEAAPTAEELKTGGTGTQDNAFTTGGVATTAVSVSELTAGTAYIAYAVVYYAATEKFSNVASAAFTTEAPPASGAAVAVSEITETGAKLTITNSDETSGYPVAFYLVKGANEAAPTAEEVKAGGQMTQDGAFTSGTSTSTHVNISELAAKTSYIAYVVIFYGETQTLGDVARCAFTTLDAEGGGVGPGGDVMSLNYRNGGGKLITVQYEDVSKAASAMNGIAEDSTDIKLTLLRDVAIDRELPDWGSAMEIRRTCTLDLAGHTLRIRSKATTYNTYGIYVEGNLTFTLEDSSDAKTGTIDVVNDGTAIQVGSGRYPLPEGAECDVNFVMKGGTVRSTDVQTGRSGYVLGFAQYAEVTIEDGALYGGVSALGRFVMKGGLIEAPSPIGVVIVAGGVPFLMTGGKIRNTDTLTALTDKVCAVSYDGGGTPLAEGEVGVHISGGTLSTTSGPALYLSHSWNSTQIIKIDGTAKLVSQKGPAIGVESWGVPKEFQVTVGAGASLAGVNAVMVNLKEQAAKEFVKIKIEDGAYCKYPENSIPVAPNSTYVTYPEGMVQGVTPLAEGTYAGYYPLAKAADLKQMIGNKEWGYQYLDNLNTAISGAKEIYTAGNEAGKYDDELWSAFAAAYEKALPIPENQNANQNEIDYFTRALNKASMEMTAQAESGVDVSQLADGIYEVNVEMRMYGRTELSMANGAVNSVAKLVVKDGKGHLRADFKPIMQMGFWGSLMQFWTFHGNTPEEAQTNVTSHSGDGAYMTEAEYLSYHNVSLTNGTITPITGAPAEAPSLKNEIRPAAIRIALPYMGSARDYNKIYCYVGVDMMRSEDGGSVGDQPVVMYIKYSTLKAVDVQDTLSLSDSAVTLAKGGTQGIAAKVIGTEGWSIAAESDQAGVAAANIQNGTITVIAVEPGTATITVTATKADKSPLVKHITVTVSDKAKVEVLTTTDGVAATATVSGTALLTAGGSDKVAVGEGNITVDAKSNASGTAITDAVVNIAADTLTALAGANKSVTIKTDMGDAQLSVEALAQIKDVGAVTLTVKKAATTAVKKTVACVDVTLNKTSDSSPVVFNKGTMMLSIPTGDLTAGTIVYAYYISNDKIAERTTTSTSGGISVWSTNHCSTWALSTRYQKTDAEGAVNPELPQAGITKGTWSVPIYIKNISTGGASMANGAVAGYALAKVADNNVTYTLTFQGMKLKGLYGHLLDLWYYTDYPKDMARADYTEYQDKDLKGKTATFPRTATFTVDGAPSDAVYIRVNVDAMNDPSIGAGQQDAILTFRWNAAEKGGSAADAAVGKLNKGVPQIVQTGAVVKSGSSISPSKLSDYIGKGGLTVENASDGITAALDEAALKAISKAAGTSNVQIALDKAKISDLSVAQKAAVGNRPVFKLTVTAGKNVIADFGTGKITVTLPYTLQTGEKAQGLVVRRVADDGKTEKFPSTYKTSNKTISFTTSRFSVYMIAYDESQLWTNPFTDVRESDWFYDAVHYVVQNKLFGGTSGTTFTPNANMTRAQLVAVLYRLDGQTEVKESSGFSDVVAGAYYEKAVIWAKTSGIVSGYPDGSFGVSDVITREQLAVILHRYAAYKKYDVAVRADLKGYMDLEHVGNYAGDAMQWAVGSGIISGTSAATLTPKGTATRAQAAVILQRFAEKFGK